MALGATPSPLRCAREGDRAGEAGGEDDAVLDCLSCSELALVRSLVGWLLLLLPPFLFSWLALAPCLANKATLMSLGESGE